MTAKITYQCSKCGQTMDVRITEKLPVKKCSSGEKCNWKKPYFFN